MDMQKRVAAAAAVGTINSSATTVDHRLVVQTPQVFLGRSLGVGALVGHGDTSGPVDLWCTIYYPKIRRFVGVTCPFASANKGHQSGDGYYA